jgi:hypothetical protein
MKNSGFTSQGRTHGLKQGRLYPAIRGWYLSYSTERIRRSERGNQNGLPGGKIKHLLVDQNRRVTASSDDWEEQFIGKAVQLT